MKHSLIINGAAGRMGRRVLALALETDFFELIGAIEAPGHPDTGKDAGLLAGAGQININNFCEC